MIDGNTNVLGLIGNPVEHTISPLIHNMLAKELGINSVYVPFKVQDNLDDAIKGAKELNIKGLNITVPYKEKVIKYLSEIDSVAADIGAVNTLDITDNGFKGYNTDALGLLTSLNKNNIKIKDSDIIIIGAGGVAKAVAMLCVKEKCNKLTIINRTIENAKNLADNIMELYNKDVESIIYKDIHKLSPFDIAFQTTPIGMYPDVSKNPIEDTKFYKLFHTAVDLIYNPDKTKFLVEAEKNGLKTINGFGMLFYQAVEAYKIWNNVDISQEILDKVQKQLKSYL